MAHKIETFAYTGLPAWHGLGIKVPDDISPDDLLIRANLNWEVYKKALFINTSKDDSILNHKIIPNEFALVRNSDDSILSLVGKNYKPVQNSEALKFFNEFVEAGNMTMETAGSLSNGQFVFALAKINQGFSITKNGKEDRIEGYLLFINPHVLGYSLNVMFTPVRVVCWNTLTQALSSDSAGRFSMRHSSVFNPDMVKQALGIASDKLDVFKEQAELLVSKKFTTETIKQYFTEVFTLDKGADSYQDDLKTYMTLLEKQPGANLSKGTYWQAFNSVTYLTNHILGKSDDNRLKSAWLGTNKNLNDNALKIAIKLSA